MVGGNGLQRSLKELAVLYGCEPTLAAIEQYRQSVGLEAISQKCFDAANIEFVLLDDGLTMDKMVSIGWHRKFVPGVHRLLCIETVAEAILNQVLVNEFSSFFTKEQSSISYLAICMMLLCFPAQL